MSLFSNKFCETTGVMLVRPWCSDKAKIDAACAAEGAGVEFLQQYDGITRFEGNVAAFMIDLGEVTEINALVLAKTNLSIDALFKIEASNSISGFGVNRKKFHDLNSKVHTEHEFPISKIRLQTDHDSNNCNCRDLKKSCEGKYLGEGFEDLDRDAKTGDSFYFSTGPLPAYCEELLNCQDAAGSCTYEADLIWVNSDQPKLRARFVKVTIFDEEADCIDLSRLFLGKAFQGDCNVQRNWGIRVVDESEIKRSRSGTVNVGCGVKFRCFTGKWSLQSERFFQEMFKADMKFGKGQELYLITQPEKTCDRHLTSFWAIPDETKNYAVQYCDAYETEVKYIEARGFF